MSNLKSSLNMISRSSRSSRVAPRAVQGVAKHLTVAQVPARPINLVYARSLSSTRSTFNTQPPQPPQTPPPPPPPPPNPNDPAPNIRKLPIKPIYIFLGLTSLGIFLTIYQYLEYYLALPKWPEPIRTPLRRALLARERGDYERSEGFFREAIIAALSIPPSELSPDPLLSISGIYITFSLMLEEAENPVEAYKVLRESLAHFGPDPFSADPSQRLAGEWAGAGTRLTHEDHIRAIGLSQKLGQLALQLSSAAKVRVYPQNRRDGPTNWLDAAEKHLGDAMTAMLKLGLVSKEGAKEGFKVIAGRDVDLPEATRSDDLETEVGGGGVDKRGLGVTMEALAEIYARKGEHGIAGNLLIQAISTLLPPKSEVPPSISDQCQAALLMTTVSSHALQPLTPKARKASKSWSLRALQIADAALKSSTDSPGGTNTLVCRKALAVGSYNLGMLAEMDGDLEESAKQLSIALKVSRDINFNEGIRQAGEGIKRIRALANAK